MDSHTIHRLEEILSTKMDKVDILAGGSDGRTYLLQTLEQTKYIFKTDIPQLITVQCDYYKKYKHLPYLPKLIYESPQKDEIIISFLLQNKNLDYDKYQILTELINNYISKFKTIESDMFGFKSGFIVGRTFSEFLIAQTKESYGYITDVFNSDDLKMTINLIRSTYSHKNYEQKYLLHGDLGFHNLYYTKNSITGIIDPDPIIGHPLYDLVFAYCSTPKEITLFRFKQLLILLSQTYKIDLNFSREYLLIGLFKRISSCRKHHPKDLPEYLQLWKAIIKAL